MDPRAIEQARNRLEKAKKSLLAFDDATNFAEAEEAWTDFLLAASSVYSKLEEGSKAVGASNAWYGRQKKARKDNHVMRYLHQARNSDEHGIMRVTAQEPDSNLFGSPQAFGKRYDLGPITFKDDQGLHPDVTTIGWAYGPRIKLIRAHDTRYNDYCDPPQFDNEDGTNPSKVGAVAIPILESMISEAEKLVP